MEEIKMSQKQAYMFAASIFADIEKYVEDHRDEFEEFQKQKTTEKIGNKKWVKIFQLFLFVLSKGGDSIVLIKNK